MKKRILIILLGLMLLVMAFAAGQAFAADATVVDGGRCNDSIKWQYLSDGTLRIYGSGKMPDYTSSWDSKPVPWESYLDDITKVVVESGITTIGANACDSMDELTEVVLPEGLISIGKYSFGYCDKLTNIVLPPTVETIGDRAFYDNKKLKSVNLPKSLKKIGEEAFCECYDLEDIAIPKTVKSIGERAFAYCYRIKTISVPEGIKTIYYETFYKCFDLVDVTLPSTITEIESYAFDDCHDLTNVYFNGNYVQWKNVKIGSNNGELTSATLTCIKKINVRDMDVTISEDRPNLYSGDEIRPDVTLKTGSFEAVEGRDYTVTYTNNINPGIATITITGVGHFEGTVQLQFEIFEQVTYLEDCKITLSSTTYTYSGKAKTPIVTVIDPDGVKLEEDSEYSVTYSNNVNAGTGKVTVKGLGSYFGKITKNFTINKAANSITTPKKTYTKTAKATSSQSFALKAKAKGGTLTYKSSKSSVKVSSTGKVTIKKKFTGKATITITAKGKNYKTATRKVTVKVVKAPATKIKLSKSLKGSPGFSYSLKPKLVYSCEKLTGLKWSSSNKKVATVTTSGKVSLKKKGTATITCKLKNGKKYTCKVTVKKNSYFNMSYSDAKFYDSGYGDINFRFLDAHFSGKTLIANFAIYNNRVFYATKFDWITYKVYYNDYNKAIKTYTMHNVPIKLGEYQKKKLTVKIPMKKVYDLAHAEDFWVEDYDYYYFYNY